MEGTDTEYDAEALFQLLKQQQFHNAAGVTATATALRQVADMYSLPFKLRKETIREEKSELLLHLFHEIAEKNTAVLDTICAVLCNHSVAAPARRVQSTDEKIMEPHGDRWNRYMLLKQRECNRFLEVSTIDLQESCLDFLNHYVKGPLVPNLDPWDDDHPAMFRYKRSLASTQVPFGNPVVEHLNGFQVLGKVQYHGMWYEMLQAYMGVPEHVPLKLVGVVEFLWVLARVQCNGEAYVQKICESNQASKNHLSEFVLEPRLLEAAMTLDQTPEEQQKQQPGGEQPYCVRLQHLIEYTVRSLDLQAKAFQVYASLAAHDCNVRDSLIGADLSKGMLVAVYTKLKKTKFSAATTHTSQAGSAEIGMRNPVQNFSQINVSTSNASRSETERARRMVARYQQAIQQQQIGQPNPEVRRQLTLELLKLENFIAMNESKIELDEALLAFFSQMCGATHSEDDIPDWLNPACWGQNELKTHVGAIVEITSTFVSGRLSNLDDPQCVAKWCVCLAYILPALRQAAARLSTEKDEDIQQLAVKAMQTEEFAFKKFVERLQGAALAALYYGAPDRDQDDARFHGVVLNNAAAVNILDEKTLCNGGVWQPAFTTMGEKLPPPSRQPGVVGNQDCIQVCEWEVLVPVVRT